MSDFWLRFTHPRADARYRRAQKIASAAVRRAYGLPPARGRRWTKIAGAGIIVFTVVSFCSRADAHPRAHEDRLLTLINDSRADAGLRPLARVSRGDRCAHEWLDSLRTRGVFHSESAFCQPHRISENIAGMREDMGYAMTVEEMHDQYMRSPGHRRNILDPRATHVGIALLIEYPVYTVHHEKCGPTYDDEPPECEQWTTRERDDTRTLYSVEEFFTFTVPGTFTPAVKVAPAVKIDRPTATVPSRTVDVLCALIALDGGKCS